MTERSNGMPRYNSLGDRIIANSDMSETQFYNDPPLRDPEERVAK